MQFRSAAVITDSVLFSVQGNQLPCRQSQLYKLCSSLKRVVEGWKTFSTAVNFWRQSGSFLFNDTCERWGLFLLCGCFRVFCNKSAQYEAVLTRICLKQLSPHVYFIRFSRLSCTFFRWFVNLFHLVNFSFGSNLQMYTVFFFSLNW